MGGLWTKQACHEPNDVIALQHKEQLDTVINHIAFLIEYQGWQSSAPHAKFVHSRGHTSFKCLHTSHMNDPSLVRKEFIQYPLMYFSRDIIGNINEDSYWKFFAELVPVVEDLYSYKTTNIIPIYFSHTSNDGTINSIGCVVFHWHLETIYKQLACIHGYTYCKFSSLQELDNVSDWIRSKKVPLTLPSPMGEVPDDLETYNYTVAYMSKNLAP